MSERDERRILNHLADSDKKHPMQLNASEFEGFDDPFNEVKAKMLSALLIRTHDSGNNYYIIKRGKLILSKK